MYWSRTPKIVWKDAKNDQKIKRFQVAPCGPGKKFSKVRNPDKTISMRNERRACAKRLIAQSNQINARIQNQFETKLKRHRAYEEAERYTHIKRRASMPENLFDLDDPPTQKKLERIESAIDHMNMKLLDEMPYHLVQHKTDIRHVRKKEITLDFELKMEEIQRQKIKNAEKLCANEKRIDHFRSAQIQCRRKHDELRKLIEKEKKSYYQICEKLENRNSDLCKLLNENRFLLNQTNHKLQLYLNLEDDFKLEKDTLLRQLKCCLELEKYIAEPIKLQCLKPKPQRFEPTLEKTPVGKSCQIVHKTPKTFKLVVNKNRTKTPPTLPKATSKAQVPDNPIRIHTEIYKLQERLRELKLARIRTKIMNAKKVRNLHARVNNYSPLRATRKAFMKKADRLKKKWQTNALEYQLASLAMKVLAKNVIKDDKKVGQTYQTAEKAIERLAMYILKPEEQRQLEHLIRMKEANIRSRLTTHIMYQDFSMPPFEDLKDRLNNVKCPDKSLELKVNLDRLPYILQFLDFKLMKWLETYKNCAQESSKSPK